MSAFEQAWTLLKQREFEVMPQQRAGPSLAPTTQQQLEALQSGDFSQVEEARRLEERRDKTEEREMDPMTRHLLNQQAEGIEAEGIDLPNGPRVSAVPPADIGRAGSLSPEPNLRELYFGSVNQTPPTKNEFITADDFMRPPQPLQFEKAWATLKALPEQQVLGPDGLPLKTLHPAIQGMMERRGTLQPEGQEIQNRGHAPGFMPLSYGRDTSEAVYPEFGVPGREIRDDENFDTATERLTRERNEAIPTEGALQGGYRTSMRPQTDLTISEGYPYEIPERGIYTSEEDYPEYATDRHPYTARFASMYGEPETMDEKFKHGYRRFMGR